MTFIQDAEQFALDKAHDFWASKTVKLIIAVESAAVTAFIYQCITTGVPTKQDLVTWAGFQVAVIWGILDRLTKAEIKAHIGQLGAGVAEDLLDKTEDAAKTKLAEKSPELAKAIKTADPVAVNKVLDEASNGPTIGGQSL